MNYNFDPETMYQPELPDVESFDECTLRYHSDGTVESLDDWPVVKSDYKGWNTYDWRVAVSGHTELSRNTSGQCTQES